MESKISRRRAEGMLKSNELNELKSWLPYTSNEVYGGGHAPSRKGLKEELTCDHCGRICLSRAGLINHKRRHLSDDSTLQYDIQHDFSSSLCNIVCSSANGLTRHHKTSHPDQPAAHGRLTCRTCGLKCKSLPGLMSHLRRHQKQGN